MQGHETPAVAPARCRNCKDRASSRTAGCRMDPLLDAYHTDEPTTAVIGTRAPGPEGGVTEGAMRRIFPYTRCTRRGLARRRPAYNFRTMIPRANRALAALSALWFAILMVAGPMVHECAMHDGSASGAAAAASTHGIHGAGHDQAPADDECDHCTCLGDCAGAAFTRAFAAADRTRPPAPTLAVAAPAGTRVPSSGSPDVRLPFSVGPPLLA